MHLMGLCELSMWSHCVVFEVSTFEVQTLALYKFTEVDYLSKNLHSCSSEERQKTVIHILGDMKVSKWWENFHFYVYDIPFISTRVSSEEQDKSRKRSLASRIFLCIISNQAVILSNYNKMWKYSSSKQNSLFIPKSVKCNFFYDIFFLSKFLNLHFKCLKSHRHFCHIKYKNIFLDVVVRFKKTKLN